MSDWINCYIPLVRSKNRDILEQVSRGFTAEDLEAFQVRKGSHEKIIVEIGSGSGMHLIRLAREAPETLHVGFELRYKRAYRTIEKAGEAGLTNIFVIRGDAREIAHLFSASELSGIYIHFPDPWIKRRRQKHRILQPEFLNVLTNCLKPGGIFSFRTDSAEYFSFVEDALLQCNSLNYLLKTRNLQEHNSFRPSSEFEHLFTAQGKPICAMICEKLADSSRPVRAHPEFGL